MYCIYYFLFLCRGDTTSSVYEYVGLEERWVLRPELELEEPKCCMGVALVDRENLQCYDE